MRLFLLILIVSTIEVVLIAKVGDMIGFFNTFLLIIATAVIGSWQLRKQWGFVMGKLQTLQTEPSQALIEALTLLICGFFLIVPGFLTDIIGFLGLIPAVRERFASVIRQNAAVFVRGSVNSYYRTDGRSDQSSRHSVDSHIIEGEFERKDDN
ncbi:MAG: FxsA protein [Gammaproteobacteria bacterium]|nr:MAG: FxsA protein [Gammaproteobacteria bacterium]